MIHQDAEAPKWVSMLFLIFFALTLAASAVMLGIISQGTYDLLLRDLKGPYTDDVLVAQAGAVLIFACTAGVICVVGSMMTLKSALLRLHS